MLTYIAFTVATNLVLAYLLSLALLRPDDSAASPHEARDAQAAAPAVVAAADQSRADTSCENRESNNLVAHASHSAPTNAELSDASSSAAICMEVGVTLRTLRERIQYARVANDKRLTKELAEQFQQSVRGWKHRMQSGLVQSGQLDAETGAGAAAAHLEMFLAQLEASWTNLDSLDGGETSDELLRTLEREVDRLEQNQRAAAANLEIGEGV